MASHKHNEEELIVTIPIDSISDLHNYQQSILSLLSRVKLDQCDAQLLKDLKTVYRLLNHFCEDHHKLLNK